MRLEEIIYNYLSSISDSLNNIAIASIGWLDVESNADYPRIIYKKISGSSYDQTHDKWERWRFYVTHADKFECQDIINILNKNLVGLKDKLSGQWIQSISKIDEGTIEIRDDNIYEGYVDYRFNYNKED